MPYWVGEAPAIKELVDDYDITWKINFTSFPKNLDIPPLNIMIDFAHLVEYAS